MITLIISTAYTYVFNSKLLWFILLCLLFSYPNVHIFVVNLPQNIYSKSMTNAEHRCKWVSTQTDNLKVKVM